MLEKIASTKIEDAWMYFSEMKAAEEATLEVEQVLVASSWYWIFTHYYSQ